MFLEKSITKFVAKVFLFLLPVAIIFAVLIFLGMRVGELRKTDSVVEFEIKHPGETLFLRRILQDTDSYKFKKLLRLKPDVLILGSSRVMQFRQEMFGEDVLFYNGGGLAEMPLGFQELLGLLPKDYQPKIIFIGLDSFEYGKKRNSGRGALRAQMEKADYFAPTNWQPYVYVAQRLAVGIIGNPARLFDYLQPKEPINGKTAIGVFALEGNGFRFDGSFQYGGSILSRRLNPNFTDTEDVIGRIRQGTAQFVFDSDFDDEKAEDLKTFLEAAKAGNIFVVGFAPPYSSEVYKELTISPRHKNLFADFRSKIPKIFAEAGFPFYDFSDLSVLGLNDQYMFDGFHPTETAAAYMMKRMISESKFKSGALLDEKSAISYLDEMIKNTDTKPFEIYNENR